MYNILSISTYTEDHCMYDEYSSIKKKKKKKEEEIQSFRGKFKFQEDFLSRRFNADRNLRRGMSGREGSALSNDMRHSREIFTRQTHLLTDE